MRAKSILPTPRRYATKQQAAEYICSSTKTIDRLIARGALTAYRHGTRLIRVDLNQLDAELTPRNGGAGDAASQRNKPPGGGGSR